jgi:hypothetical protein
MANGLLLSAMAIYGYKKNELFAIIIICGSIRFSLYQMIDLLVNKTIFEDESGIFIQCLGIKFKLNKETSFMRIDNMLILNPINSKYPTLNIYRNPSNLLGRLFKNKIKLYNITKGNYEESITEAKKISEMLDIQFKDVYYIDAHNSILP